MHAWGKLKQNSFGAGPSRGHRGPRELMGALASSSPRAPLPAGSSAFDSCLSLTDEDKG